MSGGNLNSAIAAMVAGNPYGIAPGQDPTNPQVGPYSTQYMQNHFAAPTEAGAGQVYQNWAAQQNGGALPSFVTNGNGGGFISAAPGGPQAPMSPLDQLLAQQQQQLNAIGNVGNYEMPYSQIQSMAQNLTNAQYDPQINNLLGQIAQQKQLTSVNEGKASDMYNALAQSYVQDIPQVQAQAQQEANTAKQQYTDAQQQLQQQYANQSNDQQAALNKLGIQAAQGGGSSGNANVQAQNAPGVQGVGQQQSTDQKYLQGQMALQGQQAQNQLAEQSNSATQYQHSMSDSSRLQGANDVTNLQNALQNYLTGAQTQQQSLVGAKANALSGMEGQLQWKNIQNAQTQYQNAFNRIMAQNNFGLDVQKEQDVNTNAMNSLLAALQENTQHYGPGTANQPGTSGNMGGIDGAAQELKNLYDGGSVRNAKDMPNILQAVKQAMTDANNANITAQKNGWRTISNDVNYDNGFLQQELQKLGITDPNEMSAAYQALLAYNQKLR